MAAPAFALACGAGCGISARGTLSAGIEHWSTVTGSVTNVAAPGGRGGRAHRFNPSAGTAYLNHTLAVTSNQPGIAVARFSIYFGTLPDNYISLFQTMGVSGVGFLNDIGHIVAEAQNPFTTPGTGGAVTTGVWYDIDCRLTTDTNWKSEVKIDGTDIATQDSTGGVGPISDFAFGYTGGTWTGDFYITDFIIYIGDTADTAPVYPIGAHKVAALYPTGDGTHGGGWASGVFGKGTTAATNAANTDTDIWSSLDNPLTVTAGGTMVGDKTGVAVTNYVEFVMADLPGGATTVDGMTVVATTHSASTTSSNFDLRLADNTAGASVSLISADLSESTITVPVVSRTTDRASTALDPTKVNNARIRFSSTDSNPDVYLDGVCLEVAYSTAAPTQSASISPAIFTLTPVALGETIGDANRTLTNATFTVTPVALVRAVGGVTASISPVTITLMPVVVTVLVQTSISPVTITLTPQALVRSVGTVNSTLTPATFTFSPLALVRAVGGVTSTLTPVSMTFSAVTLVRGTDTTSRTITPVSMTFSAVAITRGTDTVSKTLGVAIFTLTPVALGYSVGGTATASISPVIMTFNAIALTKTLGTAPVTLTPAIFTLTPVVLGYSVGGTATSSISPVIFTFTALEITGFSLVAGVGNILPATFALSPVALSSSIGPISTSISPVFMTLSAQAITRGSDTVTGSITPVVMTFSAFAITGFAPVPGEGNIAPIIFTFTGVALSLFVGDALTSVSPVSMTLSAEPITSLGETQFLDISPVELLLSPVPMFYTMGDVSSDLIPVTLTFTASEITGFISIGGRPYVWAGSNWVEKPVKYWTGTVWIEKPMKVWTGSEWELV